MKFQTKHFPQINQKFGAYTVQSNPYYRPNDKKNRYIDCICKCGSLVSIKVGRLYKTPQHCKNCKLQNRSQWKGTGFIPKTYLNSIIRGLKRGNNRILEWKVTPEFLNKLLIQQDFKCVYTGRLIEFASGRKNRSKTTASLDRIDSAKDYTEDNVQWVHKDIQTIKMSLTHEEFLNIINEIYTYKINNNANTT